MSDAEEEVEKHIPVIMTKENIKGGLSLIGKTFDGSSFSFIKLSLENKELDGVCEDLGHYKHLRDINLSGNHLDNINVLSKLPYILKLNLVGNKLSSLEIFNNSHSFQYLQTLNLSKNMIKSLSGIHLPKVTHLILSENQIASAHDFKGHDGLKVLDLVKNKLTSLQGIHNMASLEELYLENNKINSLAGLQNLPNLKRIQLRKNAFATILEDHLPDLPQLIRFHHIHITIVEVFTGHSPDKCIVGSSGSRMNGPGGR